MANRKRKEKKLPSHLEYIPLAPDKQTVGVEASLKAALSRKGTVNTRPILIEQHHEEYKKLGNPLSVWDAYSRVRNGRGTIPEWVLEYFDDVAKRMLKAENTTIDLPEIMGFHWKTSTRDGGPQAWEQYHSHVIRQEAVGHVLNRLKQKPHLTIPDACKYAYEKINKKWGIKLEDGPNTIKKWYYAFDK